MSNNTLNIGTRKSKLALWQSNYVADLIVKAFPGVQVHLIQITTLGDATQEKGLPLPEIGGKGLFTAELEEALSREEIDLAVHSLKDLPTDMDKRFTIAAVPQRENVCDALVSKHGLSLMSLPQGATVGTSSLRRLSQLKRLRPDLKTVSIRGNVDTRIRKVEDAASEFDATLLAAAGLNRLSLSSKIAELLDIQKMLPAPAQGALGIQARAGDERVISMLSALNDENTEFAVTAERSFLSALKAGCSTPVAAYAEIKNARLVFKGRVLSEDGSQCIDVESESDPKDAYKTGFEMATLAIQKGADKILDGYGKE